MVQEPDLEVLEVAGEMSDARSVEDYPELNVINEEHIADDQSITSEMTCLSGLPEQDLEDQEKGYQYVFLNNASNLNLMPNVPLNLQNLEASELA